MKPALGFVVLSLCLLAMSEARADPCKAIPDRGTMPSYLYRGAHFSGPVVYVGDGDSLCVAVGQGPTNWVEVRLEDFYSPELHSARGGGAKAALERIAGGRDADCVADHQSYDRVVATCRIGGRSIGDLMRSAGLPRAATGTAGGGVRRGHGAEHLSRRLYARSPRSGGGEEEAAPPRPERTGRPPWPPGHGATSVQD
jgi:endonuclease YncB( thermonuclease family)